MKNFLKYLTSSDSDKEWGLYLTVVGRYRISPKSHYPSKQHPTGYYFNWENGRILDEYQIIFITEGSGIYETADTSYKISPGTIMIVCPGIRHRYRPDFDKGWVENYIGFKGEISQHFLNKTFDAVRTPVLSYGIKMEIMDIFLKIFDLVQKQKPAYHQIGAGMVIKLLGYLVSFQKQNSFEGNQIEELIKSARVYMWDNVNKNVDIQVFAKNNAVSYSYFRKAFKKYTGISPHQYLLDLKIMRSKQLIISTDKSIKEITYELGFDSIQYFSRLFKIKTGISPSKHREKNQFMKF